MNCQALNCILDTHTSEELSSEQKQDIEVHLASCETCREAWSAYEEFAGRTIPATPPRLQQRIEAALEEAAPSAAGRGRRSLIVGSLLIASAALVASLTCNLASEERSCPEPDCTG